MKTSLFLIIVLLSGAFAGLIHGVANFAIVEPYLDQAIGIENQNMFASGEADDTLEFQIEYEGYRTWQKGGQIFAGVILGISIGSLFGIVFAMSRNSLPGKNNVKKALVLAGIMWLTLYFIPFLKYPANPPTVGDAETVVLRAILYVSFIAISGISAVGFYKISKKLQNKNKILALVGYAVFISMVFVVMPENTDKISVPIDLVEGFRATSVLAVSSFWVAVAITLGVLWNHFKPEKEIAPSN